MKPILLTTLSLLLLVLPAQAAKRPEPTARQTAAETPSATPRNPNWATLINADMNLYRVTPTLYRGEQFTKSEVPVLEKLGIKTSVNLRNFHDDSDELKSASIREIRIPINTWNIGDPKIIAALAAIRRAEQQGAVLLHCQHGADRTGLVIAMYRILYQNWSKADALDELLHGSYGHHGILKNIPRYLKNADIEKLRAAVDAIFAQPE